MKVTPDDVYTFVRVYRTQHGYSPSVQDVATGLGIVRSAAHHRIQQLITDGRLKRDSRARSITVVEEGRLEWDRDSARIVK